jgi:hypothetical protein
MEYSLSTVLEISGFHPGGRWLTSGSSKFPTLTRTPIRTPNALKEIPAAQTRRSSFSIQGDFQRTMGRPVPDSVAFSTLMLLPIAALSPIANVK